MFDGGSRFLPVLGRNVASTPQRHLQQQRLRPSRPDSSSIRVGNALEELVGNLRQYVDRRHQMSEWDDRHRIHIIRAVLLGTAVPETDFVLVVEPLLIVCAREAVQHPATEASSRSAAITLDVWTGESGTHPGAQLLKPVAQQLLKSRPDHFTCSQQELLIPVRESDDPLQI